MKPPNPLHRLFCVAFAYRAANAILKLPDGEVMAGAHCRGCQWTRIAHVSPSSVYQAGHFFYPAE